MLNRKWMLGMFALVTTTTFGSVAIAEPFSVVPNTSRVSFTSDAPFETIVGTTSNVNGTLDFNLKDLNAKSTATVMVDIASVKTGVDLRDEHMRSDQWLDTAKFPEAKFELTKVEFPAKAALEHNKKVSGKVFGKLTIKGTIKDVEAKATLGLFPENAKLAGFGLKGDVVRVKAELTITLRDFGVAVPEGIAGLKVAETVDIAMDLTAIRK